MKSIPVALSILLATSIAEAYSQEQSAPPATPPATQAAQSAPAVPTPHPMRILIGTDMAHPIHIVQPVYPADVKIAGRVVLHATIDYDGSVTMLEIVSGNPILGTAAIDAVKQWRYKPILLNNHPVQFDTTIIVVFKLDKKGNLKPQPKNP